MKIAHINADFEVALGGVGGASVYWREVIAAFCREGHAVWVISPTTETPAKRTIRARQRGLIPFFTNPFTRILSSRLYYARFNLLLPLLYFIRQIKKISKKT